MLILYYAIQFLCYRFFYNLLIIFIIGILVQIQPYVYLKEIYKVKRLRERDSSGTTEAGAAREGDGADSPTRATKKAVTAPIGAR